MKIWLRMALILNIIFLFPSRVTSDHSMHSFKIERHKVLSQFGKVLPASYILYPVLSGSGRIFRQPIFAVDGATLRLHFKIDKPAQNTAWRVAIMDATGRRVWDYTETSGEQDFWSDEIPTPSATVEIYSDEPNSKLNLRIDRLAVYAEPSEPDAIHGRNDLVEVVRVGGNIEYDWARAVARLRFISDDDDKQYYCTGFLISPDLFITNNHCIRNKSEMRSALVDFDYKFKGRLPNTYRFKEFIITDPDLDFSILRMDRVFPESERKALKLYASDIVVERADLIIIQHPGGKVQHLSKVGCLVQDALTNGLTASLTDFGHQCDTLGGSSGSPVLNPLNGQVYGLHHLGFDPEDTQRNRIRLINRAVHMKKIIELIRERRPDLIQELPRS